MKMIKVGLRAVIEHGLGKGLGAPPVLRKDAYDLNGQGAAHENALSLYLVSQRGHWGFHFHAAPSLAATHSDSPFCLLAPPEKERGGPPSRKGPTFSATLSVLQRTRSASRILRGQRRFLSRKASMNIKSLLEAGDLSAVVDAAITTNRIQAAAGADLDLCKSFLRVKALDVAAKTSERIVHLEGELGMATIIFPRPRPQAKKGADILGAESSLPAEVFAALFVKKTTIVFPEDFEAKIGKLTPAQRAIVANLVEVLAESPRVSLPK